MNSMRLVSSSLHLCVHGAYESCNARCRALHTGFAAFVAALLRRRGARCRAWLAAATAAFRGSSETVELANALAVQLQRLEAAWQLCAASCASCHLPCCALGTHDAHTCGTDHRCKTACGFCCQEQPDASSEELAQCREKAGHGGKHICSDTPHTCGNACKLVDALNCRGKCSKGPEHEGDCDCQAGNHLCGVQCALAGCAGRCTVPYGQEHDQHACENKACPEVRVAAHCVRSLCTVWL